MAFAVIQTGGKQYRVAVGNKLKIEKLEAAIDGKVVFDKVLLTVDGENVNFGAPLIAGAKVEGKVLQQGRAKKVIVFKYHSKTRRRKKNGHRQPFTEIEITKV